MSIKATKAINELDQRINALEQTIKKLTATIQQSKKKWNGPDLDTKKAK